MTIITTQSVASTFGTYSQRSCLDFFIPNRPHFSLCTIQSREDLLQSLDSFLGDCMIIPPGDWDKSVLNHTVPILLNQARELSVNRRRGAIKKNEVEPTMPETLQKDDTELDPLLRTGTCCGGLLRDIKRRFPFYLSDITDAFNTRCLMTIVFVYFACLAPAITFGGLLSEKTNAWMGVSEMILSTALCGTLYALFAGQPMIIIGATGPLLVFEKNTFELSERFGVEFLAWRAWVGLWVMVICFGIVALEGCFLIRYFTRFTEEIFACMISLIFIYDAFSYVWHEYESYPLTSRGAQYSHGDNCTSATSPSGLPTQSTANTALMATMLMLGTFFIAYGLRTLRHSHFFGQKARRIFSDLGVFIAIVAMVTIDWSASGVYTQKLAVPDGLGVTSPSKRGWFVNPMGEHRSMSPGWIFAALIPAILVSILIFMEIEFTNVILDKKDNKLKKGPGYNLDLFVAGLLVGLCSLLGLPWMCSTPVHTVSHFHALSVMSTNHAPGEHSHLVEVKEQRLTNAVIHLLIGLTVLVSPVLRHIPIAVLFGVFLYLGVSSLSHIQLCNRIRLLFIPASHHPDESYVRNVRTWKMHVFTVIQVACVCLLVAMKLTAAAPAFPFFIICMIPLRKLLERAFTDSELEELDHEFEDVYDSDMDEYDAVHVPL